jgi:hypothetical protein
MQDEQINFFHSRQDQMIHRRIFLENGMFSDYYEHHFLREVDRNIVPLLKILNNPMMFTLVSCEGHPHRESRRYPTVTWMVKPNMRPDHELFLDLFLKEDFGELDVSIRHSLSPRIQQMKRPVDQYRLCLFENFSQTCDSDNLKIINLLCSRFSRLVERVIPPRHPHEDMPF